MPLFAQTINKRTKRDLVRFKTRCNLLVSISELPNPAPPGGEQELPNPALPGRTQELPNQARPLPPSPVPGSHSSLSSSRSASGKGVDVSYVGRHRRQGSSEVRGHGGGFAVADRG